MLRLHPMTERFGCVECETRAGSTAAGWQAHLLDTGEDEDELVFYCPTCAAREFGNTRSRE